LKRHNLNRGRCKTSSLERALFRSKDMKTLRILALFLAFGFVSYQLFTLNEKVVSEMSSTIEVYSVISEGRLSLRKEPSSKGAILTMLDGKKSGAPDKVILISKFNDTWWKVQYALSEEENIQGYVAKEYLDLDQSVERFSLFWDEAQALFVEQDLNTCEMSQTSFGNLSLGAVDFDANAFKEVTVKGQSEEQKIFSGALVKETRVRGEFRVLSNPFSQVDPDDLYVQPGSVVELSEAEVVSLKDKVILVPELSNHIEGSSDTEELYTVESKGALYKNYNCCFEGQACEDFLKLKPEGDALKEILMLPFKKVSVFSKAKAVRKNEAELFKHLKHEDRYDSTNSLKYKLKTKKSELYTNFEEYFLGPRSLKKRKGKPLYRLNVMSDETRVKRGPCGSYHYNPENMGGLVGGDRYIDKDILGCFLGTLQDFQKDHPEAKVQWGDISRGDMVDFYNIKNRKLDHQTHKRGRDIDVRPIRADDRLLGCVIGEKANNSCYDRGLTDAFIQIAVKYGAIPVFFNDQKLIRKHKEIEKKPKHYDHFHLRYTKSCPDVKLDTTYCPKEGFQ